jgi:hypothetical protein
MTKDDKTTGHPVGNEDDEKRGRGIKDGTAMGQRVPKEVKDKIKPKEEK